LTSKAPIVFATGPAGSGKTLLASYTGAQKLATNQVSRIILTRPAVSVDEQHGYLPGTVDQKMEPWTRPIFDALSRFYTQRQINTMMYDKVIEVCPLAYMRGRTLDNAFIILDEAQNTNDLQLKMFLTRIGANAKAVITGDPTQIDLPRNMRSGLIKSTRILQNIDGIAHIELNEEDVVRHKLVKAIIKAYERDKD
jgi:phosphate starvation-inducible PhoH-like protein